MNKFLNKVKEKIVGREDNSYRKLYEKYRGFTMIPEKVFVGNLNLSTAIRSIKGTVVECGVWRGGMIAALAEVMGSQRKYFLYDSFEGLPNAKEIDGKGALDYQANKESPYYLDNCKAEISFAEEAMKLSRVPNFQLVKGWFSDTLKNFPPNETIAILRLDGDWYDSTMDCFNHLFDRVAKGGIIIIDDYHVWDGCSRAVHDYLSKSSSSVKISQSHEGICYIIKD